MAALALGVATVGGSGACSRGKTDASHARAGVLTVSQEQQASWIRNFNPLLPPGTARWPTVAGIYEPLLVFNTMKGEYVPWLATGYAWSDGNKKLSLTLRPGVRWSDGQPFTAKDVVFTFELTKKWKALDLQGMWKFVEAVEAKDDATVELRFSRAFAPGLLYIGHQPIVPEHVWKKVADPVTFRNEHPVGTGPFTEVKVFRTQSYELGRNPHYWQVGKPAVTALRLPAFPGNDQANLALLGDEVDWAGNFVPDIERLFVAKNPTHHHYWFPLVGGTVLLYANTTRKPFDDVRFRKALSMAIDRESVVKLAMYGYTRPADASGLSDAYARWHSREAIAGADWVKLDVAKANQMLDDAGYERDGTRPRTGPDGAPLRYDILVVTGWSDWVRAAQILAQGLGKIGITASLKTYDFSAFFEKMQKGDFDLAIGWSAEGPTPYDFYRDLMASETRKPIGEAASTNWHRFASPEADALLREFEETTDETEQRRVIDRLQKLFAESAPVIPLFPNPSWGAYNTTRFTGFPSKDDPYAKLTPNNPPENLLVLTRLKPR